MALFLSTHVNKVDRKGRVSVPAPFRAALAAQSFAGVVVYPSFVHPALDGCGIDRMEQLSESIDQFDPFSDEHDAFAVSILAEAHQLPFDGEGRILLPEPLLSHGGISDQAAFVGRGKTFQVWEPAAFRAYQAEARERARADRSALRLKRGEDGG